MNGCLRYLCLAGLLLLSCQKDDSSGVSGERKTRFSTETVQRFFEGFEAPIRLVGERASSRNGNEIPQDISPFWEQSREFVFEGLSVVQASLNVSNVRFGQWLRVDNRPPGSHQGESTINAATKLIAVEYEGEILYGVATIMANRAYLDKYGPDVVETLSLDAMEDFSGRVCYYTTQGELFGIVFYVAGEIIKIGLPDNQPKDYWWPLIPEVAQSRVYGHCYWTLTISYWCVYHDPQLTELISCVTTGMEFDMNCISLMDPPGSGGGGGGGGSGGGSGGGEDIPTDFTLDPSSLSYQIFHSTSNLNNSQWLQLERMFAQIFNDCLGGAMYSGLDSKLGNGKFTLSYDPGGGRSFFDVNNGSITLSDLSNTQALLHELFHGYQAYGESLPSFDAATANLDAEAALAHLFFAMRSMGQQAVYGSLRNQGSSGAAAIKLLDMLDSKGNLRSGYSENNFNTTFRDYADAIMSQRPDYKFDPSRNMSQNLKNLRALAQNC